MNTRLPPVSPGEILLEEYMKPLDLTMNQLAKSMEVPANRIHGIVHGTRSITADSALRFAIVFDTTPKYWLNLQMLYDLENAERKLGSAALERIQPITKKDG